MAIWNFLTKKKPSTKEDYCMNNFGKTFYAMDLLNESFGFGKVFQIFFRESSIFSARSSYITPATTEYYQKYLNHF